METIGIDQGRPEGDETAISLVREGFAQVFTIPRELGVITGIHGQNGRMIIETSSGTPMILPVPKA